MMRAIVIASTFIFALLTAGCKQETETQEPIRPVLSTVVEPTAPGSTAAVGSCGTAVQDGSQFSRAGASHSTSRQCRRFG